MPDDTPLDAELGHQPSQDLDFIFIEEETGKESSDQHWPFIPSVSDLINLRNGTEWIVTRREITYDRHLTVEVFVKTVQQD